MKNNFSRLVIQFCLVVIFGVVSNFSAAAADEVTADDFRNSHFRGFNIGGVHSGLRSATDLDALAKTGANMARIGVRLQRCADCTAYNLPFSDLATLDLLIRALAARSIYAVIVLVPMGDERGPFWSSAALQESFIDHWKMLAARYRDLPSVAGFDLLNEPVPPGLTYTIRQNTWLAYAERLGQEIRSVDPQRVLIVESAPDATTSSFNNMKPLNLKNIVYSFHAYAPFVFTHQGVAKEASKPMTYGTTPGVDVSKKALYGLLAIVNAFATKFNVPILVGEFSCVRWAPLGSAERYIADSADYFEAKGWSWMYHDFRGWHGWDAEMDSELKSVTVRSADASVMNILRAKMSENKK